MTSVAASARGLSEQEAERRLAARGEPGPPPSSRSYTSILRANLFTVFNLILLVFGILTLAFGKWQDALFLGILAANVAIGVAQEVRAKLALDRLAALVQPTARVLRDGKLRRLRVADVVEGDLVELQAGDQVVGDGRLERADGLLLDESILTGESAPVARSPGEEVRSGSFAVEGAGAYVVTAVGEQSYAARVAGEARVFRHPRSPLETALNRLLLVLVAVLVPLGITLGFALHQRHTRFSEAVPTSVAAVVTLIPEGLILLASVTYAVAAMRMARRGALAQQLNAIESLASVDTICLDKTGTLTESRLRVLEAVPTEGVPPEQLAAELAEYAASSPARNATLEAIAEAYPGKAGRVESLVPFSSRRRWSSTTIDGTTYVLGAPELFGLAPESDGRRVVAFGTTEREPPEGLSLLGHIVLAEQLRDDARATVEFLRSQAVTLAVLSGDDPDTVAAIARDAGIPVDEPLDGRSLPADPETLRRLVERRGVVGRIAPEDKKRVVEALRDGGRFVAMIGDGVNDVPALKASRLALAPESGAQMAKSVADVVLVRGGFASVPPMVAEGRKVLRNLQRVTKLFVTKSAFATFLILTIGLTPTTYPFLPRHLTLAAAITLGIPTFFLALAPSEGPFRHAGFLREVARFAVPAGTAVGLGVVASYLFTLNVARLPLAESRTVATTVLVFVGLYFILVLEASGRSRSRWVAALCGSLAALYLIAVALPETRHFFALQVPGPGGWLIALLGSAIAITGLALTDERFLPGRGASS